MIFLPRTKIHPAVSLPEGSFFWKASHRSESTHGIGAYLCASPKWCVWGFPCASRQDADHFAMRLGMATNEAEIWEMVRWWAVHGDIDEEWFDELDTLDRTSRGER